MQAPVGQSKSFGLLVYLALRRPDRFLRRDELVGVFWPESTESRARASLRQALRSLRSQLGPDVIVNRGDAEVRIARGAVRCDVVEFLRALDAGDDRRAVAAYGGELLPSFMLPGLHEFDRWLQGERQRLRAAAIQAALRLIASDEQAGEIAEAARVARWALRLEPTNEAVARRLIALLDRAGDRGAALEVYDSLRQRLSEDLDLEPARSTTALVSAIQDGGDLATVQDPLPYRPRGSISRQRVLVLPLEDLTGDASLSAMGRLAADALAQSLTAVADLEVVPPIATREPFHRQPESRSRGERKLRTVIFHRITCWIWRAGRVPAPS